MQGANSQMVLARIDERGPPTRIDSTVPGTVCSKDIACSHTLILPTDTIICARDESGQGVSDGILLTLRMQLEGGQDFPCIIVKVVAPCFPTSEELREVQGSGCIG